MIASRYLHNFYKDKKLSTHIHLEGGAALSLYYNVDRKFSNDLDFTIETQGDIDRFRDSITKPFDSKDYQVKHINENKTNIYDTRGKMVLSFDYYLATKEFCNYEEVLLDGITPSLIHSVEDIFVEKLCCMVDRDAERDVHDAVVILEKYSPKIDIVSSWYNKKQEVKKSSCPTFDDFVKMFSSIVQQKRNWVNQKSNLQIIQSYLENNTKK